MTPYFNTFERQQSLIIEAKSWLGTPFRPHAMVKGAGADCIRLALGIYQASGLFRGFVMPDYHVSSGPHLKESIVEKHILATKKFQPVPTPQNFPTIGDLLGFNFDGVTHHVGIMVGAREFVHVYKAQSTVLSCLRDPFWWVKLTNIWRPIE